MEVVRPTRGADAELSRDLRNHGGEIVERAERGERLTITRAGTPVAELTAPPCRRCGSRCSRRDAAIALAHDLPVHTNNPSDFHGIDELQVIAVPMPD